MLKENLTVNEVEKYTEDNEYNSTRFICRIMENGEVKAAPFTGKFLDAYYGLVEIPLMGTFPIRLRTLQNKFGDRNLYFDIPENDKEFNAAKQIECVLRGLLVSQLCLKLYK